MEINRILLIAVLIPICFSCKETDKKFENAKIHEFTLLEHAFDSVISIAITKYYDENDKKGYKHFQLELNRKNYIKYSKISDSIITSLLKDTDVSSIMFEKASQCNDRFKYDKVRFKIQSSGSEFQYFYVYEFCPLSSYNKVIDVPNFKSIPLGSNWYLEIEKN